MARQDYIRSFSIITHIDHGKSTLADRLIGSAGMLTKREVEQQILDSMDLEKEWGITVKLKAVRLIYQAQDGHGYTFNLIDTSDRMGFSYGVSQSMTACEGALLVVDATRGVETQTLTSVYLALDEDLEIFPILNKIDLPSQHCEKVIQEIESIIGLPTENAPRVSAETGLNIDQVLETIVRDVPAPNGDEDAPLKALIFDSNYDAYRGVVHYVRIFDGQVKTGDIIQTMNTKKSFEAVEIGVNASGHIPLDQLNAGDVGYITASIKEVRDAQVGDITILKNHPADKSLEGYKKVSSMVYCGIYPAEGGEYTEIRDTLEKLEISDVALDFEAKASAALGFGFRCGFLGLLHTEIIQERLEKEFDLSLITTTPPVIYHVMITDRELLEIQNPSNLPDPSEIEYTEEPIIRTEVMTPTDYVGAIAKLCRNRRGVFTDMQYLGETRARVTYDLPLNEVIYDFFDVLKSKTRGYASFDYDLKDYQQSDLVKMGILINQEIVGTFSPIVHQDKAYEQGHKVCERLTEAIPRRRFVTPIQTVIGSKIIARETIRALRKDVLSKCYRGNISRKKELLEKQKEGKGRMWLIGNMDIPQEAFLSILKYDKES